MAHVHFKLPDELIRHAKEAGISIVGITETAIRDALAGRQIDVSDETMTPVYDGRDTDDTDRYQHGRATGERWVNAFATIEEISSIAALGRSRWRDIALDVSGHSLGGLLVELGEVEAAGDGQAWLTRDAFVEGIVDAALAVTAESP